MKAIVHTAYGAPRDVLALQEVAAPTIADDEVVVRVKATSPSLVAPGCCA